MDSIQATAVPRAPLVLDWFEHPPCTGISVTSIIVRRSVSTVGNARRTIKRANCVKMAVVNPGAIYKANCAFEVGELPHGYRELGLSGCM